MRFFIATLLLIILQLSALAQDSTLIKLQQNMDRQKKEQKELVYSFNTITYVHKLDKQGGIEKTDTVRTWQKFKGDSLQEYTLIYPAEKKKQEHKESITLPNFNDSTYNFEVIPITETEKLGKIKFSPKKPKKGNLAGEFFYDPQKLTLSSASAIMPKLKWPVSEFEMKITFTEIDGILFTLDYWVQAAWNALISKGRMRVESQNSDFKIYR